MSARLNGNGGWPLIDVGRTLLVVGTYTLTTLPAGCPL
jgi:hypothetical protein